MLHDDKFSMSYADVGKSQKLLEIRCFLELPWMCRKGSDGGAKNRVNEQVRCDRV